MAENDRRDVLVTTEGRELRLRPVSQLLIQKIKGAVERELRAEGLPLDPPTYKVTTVTGETETHVHDETTLADEKTTDEERAAWAAYQAAQARLAAETNERALKVLLLKGMDAPDPPPEWIEEQEYLGIELPADRRELKLAYIQTEILVTPGDIADCTVKILQLSMAGMPEADIAAVEDLFRGRMAGHQAQ